MMSEEIFNLDKNHHLPLYDRFPVVFTRGEGIRVWDDKGNEYLDALAGIAVNSLGHCHPNVVSAIKKQAEDLMHVSNLFYNVPQTRLSSLLTNISGMSKVFFCNSGVEAVEGALKIARKYAYLKERSGTILSMENAFHGRSIATLALGKKKYQEGFGPLPEGFIQIPFNDIKSFKKAVNDNINAVILEVIQGEGGINVIDGDFLKNVYKICNEKDILLIADEIQCGMGRTGKMFAFEHFNVKPDIVTLAKGLGGGFPIGAVIVSEKLKDIFKFGDHGTTFGGNPLACAAALAVVETILNENLLSHVEKMGYYLRHELLKLKNNKDCIEEIRGIGLMVGLTINKDAKLIVKKMITKGILANAISDRIIRIVPPLIIEKKDLKIVVKKLSEAIDETN